MNKMKKLLYIILCLMAFENAFAQTVTWKSVPRWESAKVLGENMLKVKQFGQWGVVSFSGSEIIPCENAEITDICEGCFLLLDENNRIISLRDFKCNTIYLTGKKKKALTGDWFVDPACPYFSEGLLAIKNSKGKWGFINTLGELVIKNIYEKVYPFHLGYSAVRYNNGNWGFIDKDEHPLRSEKLERSYWNYLSSFTQIGEKARSIVWVNKERVFMIDLAGNLQGDIVPMEGVPFSYHSENDSSISFSKDDFSIELNNRGEIMFIKDNNNILTSTLRDLPDKITLSSHEGIEVGEQGIIKVDSLILSPQFQEIIPLSGSLVMVKKDNKWGILEFDRSKAPVKISCEKPFYTSLDSEIDFELSGKPENMRIYTFDAQNKTTFFDVTDGHFNIPKKYLDEKGRVILGIEENGIIMEPVEYTVPQRILEKGNYNVAVSSSTKKVKNGESANIIITIRNKAENVVPYSVYINGKLSKNGETDREVKLQYKVQNIDFKNDTKTINLKIEIQEEGVPGSLSYPKSYTFERKYNI